MVAPKLVDDTASIVLIGSFNPAIFQPAWLAAKDLLRESEATEAVIEVVHSEITAFRAGWLVLNVTRDKFVALTSDPAQHAPLRDLVVGIFELLEHTPTKLLGLNRTVQLRLPDEASWHALGHLLAPKEIWHEVLVHPGMRSLLMESPRKDGLPGRVLVKIEPRVPHMLFVEVNNELHADPAAGDPTAYFVSRIRTDWARIQGEALALAEHLASKAPGGHG